MLYETIWITQNIGTAPPPGHHAAGARLEPERGGAPGAGVGRLCLSMAASLADGGRGGLGSQVGVWGAAQIDRPATRPSGAAVAAGRQSQRLSQRAVDVETHCGR